MIAFRSLKPFFAISLLLSSVVSFGQDSMSINHQYSPAWWQTLICLPDDPVKTLVGKEGQIFGDYNYKGPRGFSFSLLFDSKQPSTWKSQILQSAVVPMTITQKESDGINITQKTFLQIPNEQALNSIERYDSRRSEFNWSKPNKACDSSFYDVAYGQKGLSGEGIVTPRSVRNCKCPIRRLY